MSQQGQYAKVPNGRHLATVGKFRYEENEHNGKRHIRVNVSFKVGDAWCFGRYVVADLNQPGSGIEKYGRMQLEWMIRGMQGPSSVYVNVTENAAGYQDVKFDEPPKYNSGGSQQQSVATTGAPTPPDNVPF